MATVVEVTKVEIETVSTLVRVSVTLKDLVLETSSGTRVEVVIEVEIEVEVRTGLKAVTV